MSHGFNVLAAQRQLTALLFACGPAVKDLEPKGVGTVLCLRPTLGRSSNSIALHMGMLTVGFRLVPIRAPHAR